MWMPGVFWKGHRGVSTGIGGRVSAGIDWCITACIIHVTLNSKSFLWLLLLKYWHVHHRVTMNNLLFCVQHPGLFKEWGCNVLLSSINDTNQQVKEGLSFDKVKSVNHKRWWIIKPIRWRITEPQLVTVVILCLWLDSFLIGTFLIPLEVNRSLWEGFNF